AMNDFPGCGRHAEAAAVADFLPRVLHIVEPCDTFFRHEVMAAQARDLLLPSCGREGELNYVGHRDVGAPVARPEMLQQLRFLGGADASIALLRFLNHLAAAKLMAGIVELREVHGDAQRRSCRLEYLADPNEVVSHGSRA